MRTSNKNESKMIRWILSPGETSSLIENRSFLTDYYTNNQTTNFTAKAQYLKNGSWFDIESSGNIATFTVYPRPNIENGMFVKKPNNPR